MQSKLSILFVFSALSLLLASPLQARIIDRIVATVNNEIITLSDLRDAKKSAGKNQTEKQVLNALIEDRLSQQLIRKLNLSPKPEVVDAQIDGILKAQGISKKELIQFLKQRGLTYRKYRNNIKRGMENQRLLDREIKSSIIVKEQDIRSYYYSHVKQKETKSRYHIRQLFLPVESSIQKKEMKAKAQRAYQESKKGVPFEKIIKKYSTDPSQIEAGGDLGFISEDDLNATLRKTVKRLRLKEVSKPITTGAGIHLVQLLEVQKEKGETYAQAKNRIERILYEKEFSKLLKRWVREKKEKAYIKIHPLEDK